MYSSDQENQINLINSPTSNRNYGRRLEGPWVFGLYSKVGDNLERRFFVIEKYDREILIPIIENEILPGSIIISDEWRAYSCLKNIVYDHRTVNHSKNFVNPTIGTGVHTQAIEYSWGILKTKILRKCMEYGQKCCHVI
ncbi:DDE Tnp IS1595 domain-containing protein [Aphis craccivora]|uniref:DDE Tnp IS1595 domain-containing protein n=1 Tax=Aphis craccivora TaxID=307492 RepID=A0A6G0Z7M9_APHCR|nr:DDE Tnp IS1595 domain-containing protein [Aphis craccivora]